MWAALIEGLREIRVPLALGYSWLLAGWIRFADDVPRRSEVEPGSLSDSLSRLSEGIGDAGRLAILSFVAVLLGSMVKDLFSLSIAVFAAIAIRNSARDAARFGVRGFPSISRTAGVMDIGRSLQAEERSRGEPYDEGRLRQYGEAELRLFLAVALLPVGAALLFSSDPSWSIAAFVAAGLVGFHGAFMLQQAVTRDLLRDPPA